MSTRWILLPGMDGIGRFRAFREAAESEVDCRALSYPPDVPLGYDALVERAREALRQETDYILIAESFSGPIAARLAAERPSGLRALVFAASFCASPLHGLPRAVLRRLGGSLFRLGPPLFLAKYLLLGPHAQQGVVDDLYASVGQVSADTFALRLQEILSVDACSRLADVDVPVLYLQAMHDRLVGESAVQAVRAMCPRMELERIAAPHMLLQTHAAAAISAIQDFLDRHKICPAQP
jgi:pimeloyl-ACP methyl ester carboxylesterase